MKEYCIYTICNGGNPYVIHDYNNITETKLKLYDIISLEEERSRPYFVDNDFFDNKYSLCANLKYFCIKERDVSEFKKYSEKENIEKGNSKLIFFQDLKNNY